MSCYTPVKLDLDGNFNKLILLVEDRVERPINIDYHTMLGSLSKDRILEGRTFLGFRRAPAAKHNHHAFEGGLVFHLLEMWDVWETLRMGLNLGEGNGLLTDSRIVRAIINHDLEKAYCTFVLMAEEPWETTYGDNQLLQGDWKSMMLLNQFSVQMDEIQTNTLVWAHGGFSEVQPKACSVLAKIAYLLDELSGNILSRLADNTEASLMGIQTSNTHRPAMSKILQELMIKDLSKEGPISQTVRGMMR